MTEILWEIMPDEYREEYREEYGEMMEDFYEFIVQPHRIHGAVRRRAVSDGPGHSAAAAPEPPASLSACLFQQLQSKYTSESEPYL